MFPGIFFSSPFLLLFDILQDRGLGFEGQGVYWLRLTNPFLTPSQVISNQYKIMETPVFNPSIYYENYYLLLHLKAFVCNMQSQRVIQHFSLFRSVFGS